MVTAEAGGSSASDSEGRFYLSPGLVFNVFASQQAMFGLDTRYVIVTGEGGSEASSLGVFLSLGIIL